MDSEIVQVNFNAARVCQAIARIGYEPQSAIMDIIDNSVAALSSEIIVSLHLRPGKSLRNRNSVSKYSIIDDGIGMTNTEIIDAFELGTNKKYSAGSLSKYGLGLKSAGLSLGTKISIISKKEGILSERYTFDIERIQAANELILLKETLSDDDKLKINETIPSISGTIIEIEGCENVNQSSPNNTITKLRERLGVVYYSFLKNKPLRINLCVVTDDSRTDLEPVTPRDILFLEQAKPNREWTEDSFDKVSPYLVLDSEWNSLTDKNGDPLPAVKVHAVAFPQARLAHRKSPLSEQEKRTIDSYGISRENSGFFIYRNGRLIRWGDSLDGPQGKLIGKDDINLRISFDITEEHDDVFHVDVSKQRLDIDDELLSELERIISRSVKIARDIRQACDRFLNLGKDEGSNFSKSTQDVPEDDPTEVGKGDPSAETIKRKIQKSEEAEQVIAELDQTNDTDIIFKKIRYSEKIPYGQVWKPHYHSKEGVFICLNQGHPFYQQFLTRYDEGTLPRLIIEAIIFSVGLAESNVYDLDTQPQKDLDRIFRRFHANIERYLSEWTYENIDIDE